jgi:hypothetical protein
MFAPVVVSVGVFGLSVFVAVKIVLDNGVKTTESEAKFIVITFILSAIAGAFSLTFGLLPLFTIRSQTRLRPQRTAVSIVHFFIVFSLFIAHFVVYTVITFNGSVLDLVSNSVENMILILIFPGCLFTPPKGMVKFVKRMVLGVEQLTIGGDYRPNNNMLPDNDTNGSSSSINSRSIPQFNDGNDSNESNDSSSSSRRSLSTTSLSVSHPISVISPPTPTPRSSPNSASPKRNEPPNVKSRSLFYPRSYLRTRLQSLPNSYQSKPQTYSYSNPPQLQLQTTYYPQNDNPPLPQQTVPPLPQQTYSYSNPPQQQYSYYINAPLPSLPLQSPISNNLSMASSSLGSDTSFYLSTFANNLSNGEGSSNPVRPKHPQNPQYNPR